MTLTAASLSSPVVCTQCTQAIHVEREAYLSLNSGQLFHQHCFTCSHCKQSLHGGLFVSDPKQNHRFHEKCYVQHVAPKCGECGEPIAGSETAVVLGDGRRFHDRCFVCAACHTRLAERFHTVDQQRFHPDCFVRIHAPKCTKCTQPIPPSTSFLTYREDKYHEACFTCRACQRSLSGLRFTKEPNGAGFTCEHCLRGGGASVLSNGVASGTVVPQAQSFPVAPPPVRRPSPIRMGNPPIEPVPIPPVPKVSPPAVPAVTLEPVVTPVKLSPTAPPPAPPPVTTMDVPTSSAPPPPPPPPPPPTATSTNQGNEKIPIPLTSNTTAPLNLGRPSNISGSMSTDLLAAIRSAGSNKSQLRKTSVVRDASAPAFLRSDGEERAASLTSTLTSAFRNMNAKIGGASGVELGGDLQAELSNKLSRHRTAMNQEDEEDDEEAW